jgi:hypothetical protein
LYESFFFQFFFMLDFSKKRDLSGFKFFEN